MTDLIFDTHAHYDSERFDADRDEILGSLKENGVGYVIDCSADWKSVTEAQKLAERYPFMYASVGIHPYEVGCLDDEKLDIMRQRCLADKVVAVGEIGLDYHIENVPRDAQQKWFIRQLKLAKEADLPVIIHSRDAAEDTLCIMKKYAGNLRGVIHCFSYSAQMAEEYLKMGYYIGIGGVLTFKNAKKTKETAAVVPPERILLETDCPYLAPEPHRGERNKSPYLSYVARALADIKGADYDEIVRVTARNAMRLFNIPKTRDTDHPKISTMPIKVRVLGDGASDT